MNLRKLGSYEIGEVVVICEFGDGEDLVCAGDGEGDGVIGGAFLCGGGRGERFSLREGTGRGVHSLCGEEEEEDGVEDWCFHLSFLVLGKCDD